MAFIALAVLLWMTEGDWTDLGPCECCGAFYYYYYYYIGEQPILEPCVCETDCTIVERFLTITGTDDCDGTYTLTCEMVNIGFGLVPAWSYYGPFGFDQFGNPCDATLEPEPIWRLVCNPSNGFYSLIFKPPAEGAAAFEPVEQQCEPFYAKFEFTGLIGLVPCCDYAGTPIGVVTN